jgi:hypothetical protein
VEPEWRPLSEQELADKSLRLAQQLAAARASLPPSENVTSPFRNSLCSKAPCSLSGPAATEQGEVPNSLRVTPED